MKNTWKTINDTLGRHKKEKKLPTSINYHNRTLIDPMDIANGFNDYFSRIGTNIASSLEDNNNDGNFKQYLNTPSNKTCTFHPISERAILIN